MNNQEEIWKDVVGYESRYMVSNLGKIKSFAKSKVKTKILIAQLDNRGYQYVNLYLKTKMKSVKVHKIVATAFLTKGANHTQINHIDGVKTNNNATNLEWCTASHNIRHAIRTGLASTARLKHSDEFYKQMGEMYKDTHYEKRNKLVLNMQTGIFYPNVTSAAFSANMNQYTLSDYLNEKRLKRTNPNKINKTNFIIV